MRSNTVYSEEVNTYRRYNLIEGRKQQDKKYMRFQRFLGITAVAVGIMELVAGYNGLIDEGGLFLIALPLGLYLVFKKELVL